MRFDVIAGNPPFNISSDSENTIAGTSGNTTLYKKFIDISLSLSDTVAMVVQRNGVRYADKKSGGVSKYCLDTTQHWNFNTGWFITNKSDTSVENCSKNQIIKKIYLLEQQWNYSAPLSGSYSKNIDKKFWLKSNGQDVYGIVDTPTKDFDECRYGYFESPYRSGSQLIFKGLESINSYVVTDEFTKAGSTAVLFFDTIEQAHLAKKFILNNLVIKYLKSIIHEKTLGMVFRYLRKFDLNQIKTGYEYPVEWNLSEQDIEKIENNQSKLSKIT